MARIVPITTLYKIFDSRYLINPRGEWNSLMAVFQGDVVTYRGSTFRALKDTSVAPINDGLNWVCMAQKGDQGEPGYLGVSLSEALAPIVLKDIITSEGPRIDVRHPDFAGGMKFDNVTDDSPALRAALAAAPAGATLVFPPGQKAYLATQVNAVGSVVIEGNGSTLRGSNITLLFFGGSKQTLNPVSVAVTANATGVVLPDVSQVASGDMIMFLSDTDRLVISPANYKYGHVATVHSVNAGTKTVYLRNPSSLDFTATKVVIYKGMGGSRIQNLNFDVTASTTNATKPALSIYGHDIEVFGCEVKGSSRSGYGIQAYGENLWLHDNYVDGFLNVQGLSDGGRIGDGIYVAGDNILVQHNTVSECKHGISAGDRLVVSNNIHFINNFVRQDAANVNATVTNETTSTTDSYYGACLDFHANVYKGALIADNRVVAGSTGINIRNGTGIVRNNAIYCRKFWSYGVSISELAVTSLLITGNEYEGQGHAQDLFVYLGVSAVDLKVVNNLRVKNGGLFGTLSGRVVALSSSEISGNIALRGLLVSATYGINLPGLSSINGVSLRGNSLQNYSCGIRGAGNQTSDKFDISDNTILGCTSGISLSQTDSFATSFHVNITDNDIFYGSSDETLYPTGIETNIYDGIASALVTTSGNMLWNTNTNSHARSIRINGLNQNIIKDNVMNAEIADNTHAYTYGVSDNYFLGGVVQTWNGAIVKPSNLSSGDSPVSGTATVGGQVYSGSYTPVASSIQNVSIATPYVWQWLRVGDTVHVTGRLDVTPLSIGVICIVEFTLPILTDIQSISNLAGAGASINSQAGSIYGDPSTERGRFGYKSADLNLQGMCLTFSYTVRP